MKKITTILCLCVLIAAFAFMFVFSVCLPRTTVSNYSTLKEFPDFSLGSLFSGKYFQGVKDYFTDTIHSRDTFIDYEARINALYGIEDEEELIIINPDEVDPDADKSYGDNSQIISDVSEITANNSEASVDTSNESSVESENTEDSSEVTDVEDTSNVIPGETSEETEFEDKGPKEDVELSGSILLVGNRALEVYYGNENGAVRYAELLNDFADKLDPSVNVYSMVIPKSSAYYIGHSKDEKYANLAFRNRNNITTISETLSDRVIDVNIYNTLGRHSDEEIYFRTDHHWQALGAYYASEVFADLAGVAFDDLSKFTEVKREGFLGTYYAWSDNNVKLLNNPDTLVAYYPDADYSATYYSAKDLESNPREHDNGFFWEISDSSVSNWYSTFIRGDSYSVKAVSNDCKNGRKLLIVKDSYGNALAPFMIEGFEEIYIIDAREYEIPLTQTIEKYGITDVLFAECTFSAVGNSYYNNLKELCE